MTVLPIVLAARAAYADPPAASASVTSEAPARWIALGVTSEPRQYDGERGVRAEVDLASAGGWILGGVASYARGVVGVYGDLGADLHTRDLEALAYVARSARFARWELRGALGVGAIHTAASGEAVNGPRMAWVEDSRDVPGGRGLAARDGADQPALGRDGRRRRDVPRSVFSSRRWDHASRGGARVPARPRVPPVAARALRGACACRSRSSASESANL